MKPFFKKPPQSTFMYVVVSFLKSRSFSIGGLSLIFSLMPVPVFADDLKIVTVTGKTVSFHVDIANTPETRETGLMNRDVMANDAGMLFVFDTPVTPQFWMKDTRIALDMVFIGADGVVKGVYDTAKPLDLTPIPSPAPVLAVLEINGGRAKTLGISTGAQVIHQFFEKDLK